MSEPQKTYQPGDVVRGWRLTERDGWVANSNPEPTPIGAGPPLVPNTTTPTPTKSHKLRTALLITLAVLATMVGCSAIFANQAGDELDDLERATQAPSFGTDPATPEAPAPPAAAPVEPVPAPEPPPPPAFTVSQQNAIEQAESYLSFSSFSRAGLLGQLTSEYGSGYEPADAEFAIAHIEAKGSVDWNAEAVEQAQSYLEFSSFSRASLLDQLTSEYGSQFTPEQAEHAVTQVGL